MEPESFSIITEFGVALAGFSGVAIALSKDAGALGPVDRFRTVSLLMSSMGAAFASTFPLLAESFGVGQPALWQFSSAGFLVILVVCFAVPITMRRSLPQSDRAFLAMWVWVLSLSGYFVFSLVILANVLAGDAAGPGPLLAGMLWLLSISALMFVRMLIRPRISADD